MANGGGNARNGGEGGSEPCTERCSWIRARASPSSRSLRAWFVARTCRQEKQQEERKNTRQIKLSMMRTPPRTKRGNNGDICMGARHLWIGVKKEHDCVSEIPLPAVFCFTSCSHRELLTAFPRSTRSKPEGGIQSRASKRVGGPRGHGVIPTAGGHGRV